jgi:uncharacterized protein (TIGR03067 family)
MKRLLTIFAIAGLTAFAAADDKKVDSSLDGTYMVVSGESDGKPIPSEKFAGGVVTFVGDKVFGTDKDKKAFFSATFTIDASTKPSTMHMTSKSPQAGTKADGIVARDGDTLKLCYALPGGATPTEFKGGEKQHYFILKLNPKK